MGDMKTWYDMKTMTQVSQIVTPIIFYDLDKAINALCMKKNKGLSYFIVIIDFDEDTDRKLKMYNYRYNKSTNEYIQLNNNMNTIIRVIKKERR